MFWDPEFLFLHSFWVSRVSFLFLMTSFMCILWCKILSLKKKKERGDWALMDTYTWIYVCVHIHEYMYMYSLHTYMYMCGWVPLLSTWNYHTVNWPQIPYNIIIEVKDCSWNFESLKFQAIHLSSFTWRHRNFLSLILFMIHKGK